MAYGGAPSPQKGGVLDHLLWPAREIWRRWWLEREMMEDVAATSYSSHLCSGIFNAWADHRFLYFMGTMMRPVMKMLRWHRKKRPVRVWNSPQDESSRVGVARPYASLKYMFLVLAYLPWWILLGIISTPVIYMLYCIPVSLDRLMSQDYGQSDGDAAKANLKPAMNIFHTLVVAQGTLYTLWYFMMPVRFLLVRLAAKRCELGRGWGRVSVYQYMALAERDCRKDTASIQDRDFITYAVELLGSDSGEEYLAGARMLDAMIAKHPVRVLLLIRCSRKKMKRLIATLAWTRPDDWEIRRLAARIVAHLAGFISLAQFPGALDCVSSLLEPSPGDVVPAELDEEGIQPECPLIRHGLQILERLADDRINCRKIVGDSGLVAKITAPMFSSTLIHDMALDGWVKIADAAFRVVAQLVGAPGETGRELRREIATHQEAFRNMDQMLSYDGACPVRVKTQAIRILTHLFMDNCTGIDSSRRERFIEMVLHIFLSHQGMKPGVDATDDDQAQLQEIAGAALVMLSSASRTNCEVIVRARTLDVLGMLTKTLDAHNGIAHRTTAAELLENLFFHCTVDHTCVKETILPKALMELLRGMTSTPQKRSDTFMTGLQKVFCGKAGNSDKEDQAQAGTGNAHAVQRQGGDEQGLQAALLSLVSRIHVRELVSAEEFRAVVQQQIAVRPADALGFVAALVEMVKSSGGSSAVTADGLRVVKATGELVVSMLKKSSPYVADIRDGDEDIVELLSEAARGVACLENRLLFVGAQHQVATARPLLHDIVEEARKLLRRQSNVDVRD